MRRMLLAVVLLAPASTALGQGASSALKDRVDQLVEKLGAKDTDARDAAEKALVGLGVKVIPLLPEGAKVPTEDVGKRLEKVRAALAEDAEKASLVASRVTIQAKGIRLTEAIKQLQSQTGNAISDLREANGEEVTNPAFDLEVLDKPFFEALDLVAKQAGITLNFYTGDGSIGIMTGGMMMEGQAADAAKETKPPAEPMVLYPGPFRVQLKQYASARDYSTGAATANAQFEIAWEPRLRPMLLGMKAADLKIVDDLGNEVKPTVTDESGNVVLRPENPVAEVNVNMMAPDRKAQAIKSLKFKADVTIPAGLRTFKFPSLSAKNATVTQGDVAVTLESAEVDEQVWKVNVLLAMPGEGPAFESYRQGLFNNRIWLQKADGTRFEHNGGFSNTASDGGKLGFEYLFVDVPGKLAGYGFVYETPSKVLTIPLEFELKDVPLP